MDEGSQKIQTSSYKINKYSGCNVQHDKHNQHCCKLYMKVVKNVNPEFATQAIFISLILYLYEMMDDHHAYCDNCFMIYVSQIIMLYTLNFYSAVCQLYLNKTGRKKIFFSIQDRIKIIHSISCPVFVFVF